jgi:hypothetical protein
MWFHPFLAQSTVLDSYFFRPLLEIALPLQSQVMNLFQEFFVDRVWIHPWNIMMPRFEIKDSYMFACIYICFSVTQVYGCTPISFERLVHFYVSYISLSVGSVHWCYIAKNLQFVHFTMN